MPRALVTGGGGFLGSAIVRMLRARGDGVVVLGRRTYPEFEQVGATCIQADLRDPQAVLAACRGVDVVFHAAALAGVFGDPRAFWTVNVDGTRNVISACFDAGVQKLVYTSTPSVVFGSRDLSGVDESVPYPARHYAEYPRTKALAEQMVLSANGPALATLALRPHLIFGPGDPHLIPRVIARAKAGKLRRVGDGKNKVDVTYVDNAAEAHVLAADALKPGAACAGRPYFISQGQPVVLWDWLNALLARLDIEPVSKSVPFRVAFAAGAALEAVYRVRGKREEPPMTRFVALQLAKDHYFNISAAQRDLGYRPRVSVPEAVDRLVTNWTSGVRRGDQRVAVVAAAGNQGHTERPLRAFRR